MRTGRTGWPSARAATVAATVVVMAALAVGGAGAVAHADSTEVDVGLTPVGSQSILLTSEFGTQVSMDLVV
jgi:hypothetical protein